MTGRSTGRRIRLQPDAVLDVHDAETGSALIEKGLGKGFRWVGLSQVAVQVFRVLSVLVLTRLLEPREFGLVALATVVTGLFERVLGDTGTTTAVIRHKRLTQGLASSVLFWNLGIGLVTSGFFIAAGGPIASLLGDGSVANLVRVLGLLALINATSYIQLAILRRSLQFSKVAIINLINAVVTGLATIGFAIADFDEWSIVWGTLAGSVAANLTTWVISDWRPSLYFSRADANEIRNFSAYMSARSLFGYLSLAGDRFVVGRFIGATELGFYGLANRLLRYPIQTTAQTYREVVSPSLAKIQDDKHAMLATYRRTVGGIAFVMFPICFVVAALGDPLVRVVLGTKWVPTIELIVPVALAGALQTINPTTGSLYTSQGRADLLFRWSVGSSIVMMICYAIGAFWGTQGVAWSYFIGIAALTYPAFAIPLRLIDATPRQALEPIVGPTLAAAVAAGAAAILRFTLADQGSSSLVQLVAGGALAVVIYGAYSLVARPLGFVDLLRVLNKRR